jgi:hypothetical protein
MTHGASVTPDGAPDATDVVDGPVGSSWLKDPATSGPIGADLEALPAIDGAPGDGVVRGGPIDGGPGPRERTEQGQAR